MSFGLTTASAIFFFREKFGNVITKLGHVVGICVRKKLDSSYEHGNEAMVTRQKWRENVFKDFIFKNFSEEEQKETRLVNLCCHCDCNF